MVAIINTKFVLEIKHPLQSYKDVEICKIKTSIWALTETMEPRYMIVYINHSLKATRTIGSLN